MKHMTILTFAITALLMLIGLVLPAALRLQRVLAVRPGAIRADVGPFDDSSVVPSADEVGVGDEAGFALYVVNSGPVTATEVLVWNPLPTRTTYVSASGGAFPVIGSTVMSLMPWQMGAGLSQPPEGHAYDARVGASAPLTDPTGVTGIAWVGDVPPGEMQTLGLIAGVNGPGERTLVDEMFIYDDRELAGRFSGQTWVRPFSHYLPLVANRAESPPPTPTPVPTATTTTVTFTIPYGEGLALGGGSKDPDYWQALTGSDLEGRFGDGNGVSLGQSPPDGPYIPDYTIVRAYAGWETAALPDEAEVLSATLVLEVGCNPPESPFGTTVYRGIWTPPLSEDAWYAMGDEPAGTWDTADYPCTGHVGSGQVRIELNPTVVNQTGLTLLEIRSDREGTPPTAYERIRVTRSPQFPALVITCVEKP